MARDPTSLRLSESEKRTLDAAARLEGRQRADLIRSTALEYAVTVLERELDGLEPDEDEEPRPTTFARGER